MTSDCLFFIFYDHVERRCDQPLERDRVGASALSPTQHKRKVLETHNEISGVAPSEHCSTVQLSRCTARFSTVRGRPAFRVKPESPVSPSLAHSSMKYVAPLSTLQHHPSCDAARRLFTRMYTMNHASEHRRHRTPRPGGTADVHGGKGERGVVTLLLFLASRPNKAPVPHQLCNTIVL